MRTAANSLIKEVDLRKTDRYGFTTLQNEVSINVLPLQGKIPDWLSGTLIRNGPAKFEIGKQNYNHWFDGLAMLHKFSFTKGNISYRNKFIRSKAYKKAEETGKISFPEFATDPCRSIFSRVSAMFSSHSTDNTNVNLTQIANKFIAMTETPIPIEFDPHTLKTVGVFDFNDHISGQLTTAHPHHDFDKKETINYMTQFSRESRYNIYKIMTGKSRELIASIRSKEPSYMHSFALTENYIILVEFPLVINPLDLIVSGKPFIENFRWKPERGTKFTIVSRSKRKIVGSYITDPFFAFHHVNAFEIDDKIVLDIITYQNDDIIRSLYLDVLRGNIRYKKDIPTSELRRYEIRLNSSSIEYEIILSMLELPRINYRRTNMKDYEFMYSTGTHSFEDFTNRLIKINVKSKDFAVWSEKGCHPGEPVFVARHGGVQEDDGLVLSVVLDSNKGNSFLLVLNAQSFEEIARAEVPHHIPYGIHGQYYGDIN
jgi:beta,beta-carotene 9',10'-dioxygenase